MTPPVVENLGKSSFGFTFYCDCRIPLSVILTLLVGRWAGLGLFENTLEC